MGGRKAVHEYASLGVAGREYHESWNDGEMSMLDRSSARIVRNKDASRASGG